MCKLNPVSFHNDTIFCVTLNDQPYTPAKPIVENMGIQWGAQQQKLQQNRERWGISIIDIPSSSGVQKTLCIPVRKLPAFLASINPKKVRADLRNKVILYQNECDDALWDYWTKGRAERQSVTECNQLPPVDSPITPDQQCTLQSIVKAKVEALPEAERPRMIYAQIWSRFKNHFRIAKYDQLPQTRMSEAVEYLTQLEIRTPKAAIEDKPEEKFELPSIAIPTPVPVEAPKQLEALHKARNACRWELLPKSYRADDPQAVQQAQLGNDLYKLQDALWAALYNVCSAAAHIRDSK